MDKIRDISITEAILHVLDTNSDEPILNNYKMDLTEESYKFILSHIERVLKDENLKYATFKHKGTPIKTHSQEYLNGRMNLNDTSIEFAKWLFAIMKDTTGIPSCDLLVISFNTEYGPMLGILKMDYVKQYTHKIDIVDSNVGIGLMPIITGLSASKKVQKAAFIRPIRDGQEYDLLVLDKGTVKSADEYGATYFIENFLGCLLKENDRDITRTFMALVEIWTRSNCKNEAAKAEKIRTLVKANLINNDEINIYDLAEEVFPPFEIETKKAFLTYLQESNIERFQIDKEYLEKKLNNVKIKVSSDIEINITGDAYQDINKFEVKDNGDGSIHMIIKNIENYVEN